MPIDKQLLAAIARRYVEPMTSIRGRRVQRLLLREFVRYDVVLPATAEDNTRALLALSENGSTGVCRTDGRGAAADIVEWRHLHGAAVTTSYDLAKDSLPLVSWTIWHPSFIRIAGALTIAASDVAQSEQQRITLLLRTAAG